MSDAERIEELLRENRALKQKIAWLLSLPGAPLDGDATGDEDPSYVDPHEGYKFTPMTPYYGHWTPENGPWREFCHFWWFLGTTVEREQAKAKHEASIDEYLHYRGTLGRSE